MIHLTQNTPYHTLAAKVFENGGWILETKTPDFEGLDKLIKLEPARLHAFQAQTFVVSNALLEYTRSLAIVVHSVVCTQWASVTHVTLVLYTCTSHVPFMYHTCTMVCTRVRTRVRTSVPAPRTRHVPGYVPWYVPAYLTHVPGHVPGFGGLISK